MTLHLICNLFLWKSGALQWQARVSCAEHESAVFAAVIACINQIRLWHKAWLADHHKAFCLEFLCDLRQPALCVMHFHDDLQSRHKYLTTNRSHMHQETLHGYNNCCQTAAGHSVQSVGLTLRHADPATMGLQPLASSVLYFRHLST